MTIKDYDTFIFSHIPKCGGSSFRKHIVESCIASNIDPSKVYAPGINGVKNDKNIPQLTPKELNVLRDEELKVIADHSLFGVHRKYKLKMAKPFYYTIFREPVERFMSHYNFFYFKLGYANCKGVSLNELDNVKRARIIRSIADLQVNYVTNTLTDKGKANKKRYLLAINNLERYYACFGMLNDMGKSLDILNRYSPEWITWKQGFPTENRNAGNKGVSVIKPEIIAQIQEINKFDMYLYEFAEKLFHLRYEAYCENIDKLPAPPKKEIENTEK